MKLRHQNKEILDELQKFFRCGKVYIQRDKRKNHTLCYRFEVQHKGDIFERIIPFFEKNMPKIPSRRRDFILFKKIGELVKQEPLDFEKIRFLKQQMHWGSPSTGKLYAGWGTKPVFTGEGNARHRNRVMLC